MNESDKRYWLKKYYNNETIEPVAYDSESFSGLRILYANEQYIICQKQKRFGSEEYDKPKKRMLCLTYKDGYYFLYNGRRHYIDNFIRVNYGMM